MTAYVGQLAHNQHIYLKNQGEQTQITLQARGPGQQQSQQSNFTTGTWTAPPTLFQTIHHYIVRLEGAQGQLFVQISGGGLQVMTATPSLVGAQVLPLQVIEAEPTKPFQPLPPLQPMRPSPPPEPLPPLPPLKPMSPMEPMAPMRMEMGDMRLEMGGAATSTDPTSKPRFCSQCGTPVQSKDRFCAQCGHRLGAS
jgi:hypothetical protein